MPQSRTEELILEYIRDKQAVDLEEVVHALEGASSPTDLERAVALLVERNELLFDRKWRLYRNPLEVSVPRAA